MNKATGFHFLRTLIELLAPATNLNALRHSDGGAGMLPRLQFELGDAIGLPVILRTEQNVDR